MNKVVSRYWQRIRQLPWQTYWQQFKHQLALFLAGLGGSSKSASPRWLLVITSVLIVGISLLSNWRLGLAMAVGSLAMVTIYAMQSPMWMGRWQAVKQWLGGSQAPLVLAAGGGGAVVLGTYTLASIWAESSQRWLTSGAILQGLATLAILGLLLWEWGQRRHERSLNQFEVHLSDVASPDAFKRLLGVRRLQGLIHREDSQSSQARLAVDYLRLALDQESVPVVREAMLETLQGWGILRRLDQQGDPLPSRSK